MILLIKFCLFGSGIQFILQKPAFDLGIHKGQFAFGTQSHRLGQFRISGKYITSPAFAVVLEKIPDMPINIF